MVERLKFISPALLVHSAVLDLTGTGLARHRQFMAQVERHHLALRDYFVPKLIKGEYAFSGFDEVPRFRYEEEPAGDLSQRLASDLLGLLVPSIVLLLLASGGLRRYSVVTER